MIKPSHRWVQAVFAPRGVAVVGSSYLDDPSKLAWGTLRAVRQAPPERRPVVAIDRHCDDAGTTTASSASNNSVFSSPDRVPTHLASSIDLAILVSHHTQCLERMQQCIASFPALQAVQVVSGGFRETAGGAALERKLVQQAENAGIRLLGPNSLGSIDTYNDFASMFLRKFPSPGGLSLVSQSGGVCGAVVELLSQQQSSGMMGMSKVLSLGNAAHVGFTEALQAVGEDPHTRVVLLHLEGLRGDSDRGDEFLRVAKDIALDKPIVALKAGASQAAARAVSSHTGALAGNHRVYDAALRAAGIVQATSLRNMLELAHSLSCRRRVVLSVHHRNNYRVAVVTNAGGPAALTVDTLVKTGAASVPSLPESLQKEIHQRPQVHALSGTSNPIDLLGGATPQGYRSAIEASLESPDIDAVVALHVPIVHSVPKDWAQELVSASLRSASKPLVGMLVSSDHLFMEPALSLLNAGSIPTFSHAEGVSEAFRAWKEREDRLFPANMEAQQKCFELSDSQRVQCGDYLDRMGPGWVLEHDARRLLDLVGIEQPKAELVSSGRRQLPDILEAAEKIGYPVVLKRVDQVHKSKAGGVALNLQNSSQVRAAFQKMCPDESSTAPMLVCEYISAETSSLHSMREFLIGVIRDETFGPAVCFGSGGSLVEAIGDVAFALPPETRLDTLDLVRCAKLAKAEPALDVSVIADAVEKIAALARAFPTKIAELDLNPLMVGLSDQGETKVFAADIKFRLSA